MISWKTGHTCSCSLVVQAHRTSNLDTDRLATERLIASKVLSRVYDASPIVRAEVALVLARLCSGHSDLFQVPTLQHHSDPQPLIPAQFAPSRSIP